MRYVNINDVVPTVNVIIDGKTVMVNKADYLANPDGFTLAEGEAEPKADLIVDSSTISADKLNPSTVTGVNATVADDQAATAATEQQGEQPPAPPAVFPAAAVVAKTGKRFYVVDAGAENARVEFAGIDHENGYGTEAEAWAAVMAAKGAQPA